MHPAVLIETVDLVHKEDGPDPHAPAVLGLVHDFLDFFDPARGGTEIDKVGLCLSGNDTGEGGFPDARRPPEYHGRDFVLLYELTEYLSLSQQMFLPHKPSRSSGLSRLARGL